MFGSLGSAPTTHNEAVERHTKQYERLITQGGFVPNTYPLDSLIILIPFLYLLLPRYYNSLRLRLATLAGLILSASYHVFFTRAKHPSTAALVGIFDLYVIMLGVAHVGLIDAKTQHARVVQIDTGDSSQTIARSLKDNPDIISKTQEARNRSYKWQTFPDSFLARFDWVLDLLTTFDGAGWTWAVPSVAAPPARVQEALAHDNRDLAFDTKKLAKKWSRSKANDERITSAEVYRQSIREFCTGYVIIDICKTLLCLDPWFFGELNAPPPPYVPHYLQYPMVIKAARLLIGQGCVHYAISNVVILRAVICSSPLIRSHIGVRGEAWLHLSPFGSFQHVMDRGLLGFWSEYWHQSFRHIFTAPSRAIIRHLGFHPISITAQTIRLFLAFIISGVLHASISYTSLGESNPLKPFTFFLLQPIGIITQLVAASLISRSPIGPKLPKWLCQASNLAWVLFFGYLTGPLLIEDFARGGNFLLQPIPFSPLRGLGLGRADDGFLCWRGSWFTWRSQGWSTGLEL